MPISFPWARQHDTIDIRGKWILEAFSQFHLYRKIRISSTNTDSELYLVSSIV